jgi:hypothetical protein
MAETVISTNPLEMISTQRSGHQKSRGIAPCPDVQAYVHGYGLPVNPVEMDGALNGTA